MRLIINPDYFNAVMIAAGKEDVREFLNGFYIDFERNVVVGTDGHRLITVPFGTTHIGKKPENIIYARLSPNGLLGNTNPIPQKFKAKSVYVDTNDNKLTVVNGDGKEVYTEKLTRVDAKFPEYTKVLASSNGLHAMESVGFNALLISGLQKTLNSWAVKCSFHKDNGPILVEFQGHPSIHCTLMPCRVD